MKNVQLSAMETQEFRNHQVKYVLIDIIIYYDDKISGFGRHKRDIWMRERQYVSFDIQE